MQLRGHVGSRARDRVQPRWFAARDERRRRSLASGAGVIPTRHRSCCAATTAGCSTWRSVPNGTIPGHRRRRSDRSTCGTYVIRKRHRSFCASHTGHGAQRRVQSRRQRIWRRRATTRPRDCGTGVTPKRSTRSTSDSPAIDVAFSPDGRHLATTEIDGAARVWDLRHTIGEADSSRAPRSGDQRRVQSRRHAPRHRRRGPHRTRLGLAPSNCGAGSPPRPHRTGARSRLQSRRHAVGDGEAPITRPACWDVRHPDAQPTALHHGEGVTSVAFNRDGVHLATGSDDGTARVWDCEECGTDRDRCRPCAQSASRATSPTTSGASTCRSPTARSAHRSPPATCRRRSSRRARREARGPRVKFAGPQRPRNVRSGTTPACRAR